MAKDERSELDVTGATIPGVVSSVASDVVALVAPLLFGPMVGAGLSGGGLLWKVIDTARATHDRNELCRKLEELGVRAADAERAASLVLVLAARMNGLEATVRDIEASAATLAQATAAPPTDLRIRLLEPDMVFLLGVARDHYAVSQFRSRLRRFAAVLAGRVLSLAGEFERDLHFARVALELSDEAIRFLGWMCDAPPPEPGVIGGFRIAPYCSQRPSLNADELQLLELGARAAVNSGLLDDESSILRAESVRLVDGALVTPVRREYDLTAWGRAFMSAIACNARAPS